MNGYEEKLLLLEKENLALKSQVQAINNTLHELCGAMNGMLTQIKNSIDRTDNLCVAFGQLSSTLSNIPYELKDPQDGKIHLFYPKFRSNEETLRLITEEGKSLARFGDGEFTVAFHICRQKFQRVDEKLAKRIWEVVQSSHPDLLIAIADNYGLLSEYSDQAAMGIRMYMTEDTRRQHEQIIPADRIYSNAYITRPYVMYRDVFTEGPKKRFDALKKIWADKKVIVVEGAQTRLGVGNDLLDGASCLRRIIAPATSSFDRYDDILAECLRHAESADLFLLAIGPSSGILAYDLTVNGYQAVDVGHIDLEYEWFRAGRGTRVPVPHKYNNELEGGDMVEPVHDPAYESSVIASFA